MVGRHRRGIEPRLGAIDHLGGVLCIDRMYSRTLMTQENYAQYWGAKSIDEIWQEIEPERTP
jgi:hypothetical protein